MFVHSRSYPENHTRFQTKMGKLYIRLQTKIAQKPLPDGAAHTYMAYIRQYPPPARPKICQLDARIAGSHCHAIKNENQKHNVTQYRIASEKALRWTKETEKQS